MHLTPPPQPDHGENPGRSRPARAGGTRPGNEQAGHDRLGQGAADEEVEKLNGPRRRAGLEDRLDLWSRKPLRPQFAGEASGRADSPPAGQRPEVGRDFTPMGRRANVTSERIVELTEKTA
jgi:hypothetical protein